MPVTLLFTNLRIPHTSGRAKDASKTNGEEDGKTPEKKKIKGYMSIVHTDVGHR